MTVTYARQILGATEGHPAVWNYKTLVLFDDIIFNINEGIIPDNIFIYVIRV